MVAIGNKEHEKDLVHLANHLGDEIIGLHINKVPPQTALKTAAQKAYNKIEQADDVFKNDFEMEVDSSCKCKYIEVFSHNIAETILNQAEEENVNLLIIGWHKDNRLHHYIDNISHKIISHASNHLAILKGYFPKKIEEIVVPFGGGDSSQYAFYLAKRLADNLGAKIKLLKIVDPEIKKQELDQIRQELSEYKQDSKTQCQCMVESEIIKRFSIADALIESCNKTDLMIMGDTNKRFKFSLFGRLPRVVSKHSDGPLLLVKRYRPLSKRGIKSYVYKKKTNSQPTSQ
ncbi:MAG: universal stress protein [Bacillota bacterium]